MMKAWGLYASAPRLPPPAPAGRGSASAAAAAAAGEEEMTMTVPPQSNEQHQLVSGQQRRAMPEPALFLLDADGQVVFSGETEREIVDKGEKRKREIELLFSPPLSLLIIIIQAKFQKNRCIKLAVLPTGSRSRDRGDPLRARDGLPDARDAVFRGVKVESC